MDLLHLHLRQSGETIFINCDQIIAIAENDNGMTWIATQKFHVEVSEKLADVLNALEGRIRCVRDDKQM
jgi:hypothetical protein